MQFQLSPGSIAVSDDRSGKYPTLFDPRGCKLRFQDDGSSFNDAERKYRWVFQCPTAPVEGDRFVFATSTFEAVGLVVAGAVQVGDQQAAVERAPSGAPLAVYGTPRARMTIMIVTMNRREILEKTLHYLYETTDDSERDLLIWDNASTDDTPDFLGTMVGWPGVRVFRSKADLGVAGPRKRMLPSINTPYIFTLDDDVWMISKGWASAVVRALDADQSIHQLIVQQGFVHSTNNFGTAHEILGRPFFRVPLVPAQDPGPEMDISQKGWLSPDVDLIQAGGETLLVPLHGKQLPFAASGGAAAWRTANILSLSPRQERHIVCDLRESWGFPLMEANGTREAMIFRYGAFHPCPGALWHLGHGEGYWAERVKHSQAIYNRSAEEQKRWLETARAAVGWGRPLDDPDQVL